MKSMVYFLLCDILLVLLVILSSCDRQGDPASAPCPDCGKQTFLECPACMCPGQPAAIRFQQPPSKDSSVMEQLADKSRKDFIRWSTSGGM